MCIDIVMLHWMKKYFCCFGKKTKKTTINSYVEYYSNYDTMSESSINNTLIDAIGTDNDIEYLDNPVYLDKHTTVVGGRNPQEKKLKKSGMKERE